jgi:peptide/nickel transport system permease protein
VVLAALLILISFAVFSLLYISLGSILNVLLAANPRTPQELALLTREFHLNNGFWEQYWLWAGRAMQEHFGTSIQTSLPTEALAPTATAYLVKHTQAAMIGMLDQDYMTGCR